MCFTFSCLSQSLPLLSWFKNLKSKNDKVKIGNEKRGRDGEREREGDREIETERERERDRRGVRDRLTCTRRKID